MKQFPFILYIILTTFLAGSPLLGQSSDIQNIVNSVCGDSIFFHIDKLQDMERYAIMKDMESAEYITDYMGKNDLDTIYYHEFNQDWLPNIVGIKYGSSHPELVYVLGAHYDAVAICDDFKSPAFCERRPGADDNASGTAGVLEAIRVLAGYEFEKTIIYVFFSGEEEGLIGSEAYVEKLVQDKINTLAMINLDMISYVNEGDILDVSICRSMQNFSLGLWEKCVSSLLNYIPELGYSECFLELSDHASFWRKKIPALLLIDESDLNSFNFNWNIHTEEDTIGLSANSEELAEMITKTTVATLLELDNTEVSSIKNIDQTGNNNIVQYYTNPVKDILNIEIDILQKDLKMEIFNAFGQKLDVINISENLNIIDFSSYSSGVYFIRILNNTMKIIKE